MLLRTYHKIIKLFKSHYGYMNFSQLQYEGVTQLQIQELTNKGILNKFAWGWYWCGECGLQKPNDYRYLEIAKVNPQAVICLDSACYLLGIIGDEPLSIAVATERSDRKKMELDFPIRRFYLQNAGLSGEIYRVDSEFGHYCYYSPERTFCDCFRMKDKLEKNVYLEIENKFRQFDCQRERIYAYAKVLRALRNVEAVI